MKFVNLSGECPDNILLVDTFCFLHDAQRNAELLSEALGCSEQPYQVMVYMMNNSFHLTITYETLEDRFAHTLAVDVNALYHELPR